ncbi:zinc-dependent alcohol dehydrogenase family protein [Oryzifoliimicrobium ureilyticus]|uniref:zinc-dependent alcohol dehydrogenase family protein n=1 Tax=Oryzifoliimicrobium ureilyticus TaxID=3113724 RepID=UPI00307639D3
MKALVLEEIGKLVLRDVEMPETQPDEILVKVEACGICGTDRHLLHGEFPAAPPVTLGHELTGVVQSVGAKVRSIRPGMRVTCDPNIACGICPECRDGHVNLCRNLRAIGIHRNGGFAEYVAMPETQAVVLPDALDPLYGALCEPLACCLHGVDLANIRTGSSVAVLGGGVIGLLVVQLARLAGATNVVLLTRSAEKRKLAEGIGATATIDPSDEAALAEALAEGGLLASGAHTVFECAGVAETVKLSPSLARRGGTVVILGVLPQGEKVEIEPFDILFREIKLIGSFVNPFTQTRAAGLIASGAIKVEPLITRKIGFSEALETIHAPAPGGEIRALLVPSLG